MQFNGFSTATPALTRFLDSQADLDAGLSELAARDTVLARIVADGPRPAIRRRRAGFAGLASIVVGQQVSTASAAAIWARLEAAFDPLTPGAILAASDAALKAPGLSAPKIRTLRAIARAIDDRSLPLETLGQMKADDAHARLVAVAGIGPWTADVYLLFCLGHADAFAAGDLALQEAARLAYGFEARPGAKALAAFAERWRPWRGVAATVLWAHYRIVKKRDGVIPT